MRYASPVTPRYPTVHVPVEAATAELVSDRLFELGATGVEERDGTTLLGPDASPAGAAEVTLVAHFPDEASARAALSALPAGARVEAIVGDDWRDGWRAFFEPSRVGGRVVVRPPWKEATTRPGDVVVVVDPGQAFGTGTHETTRLVLAALDTHLSGGEAVLDVGCGSGILAVAALLLGARRATCLDVDPEAVRATRETAARNGVAERLSASADPVSSLAGAHDVVLANIEARVLLPMADTLAALVAPGGWLVLSGILDAQADEVARRYEACAGLGPARRTAEGGWVALRLERAP